MTLPTVPTPTTRHLTVAGVLGIVLGTIATLNFSGVHGLYQVGAVVLTALAGIVAAVGKSLTDNTGS